MTACRAISWTLLACAIGLQIGACGGTPPPPKNGILENDLGAWTYRRSQQLLDVEVWVPKNHAVAYTASYVYREAEKRGRVEDRDVVNAFVTRYESDVGVQRALVKFARRLAQESGYSVEDDKVGGARVILVSGHGEKWAMWAATRHVVKIGGPGIDDVPSSLVGDYAKRYPSRLAAGLLEGPLPPGDDRQPRPGTDEEDGYDSDNPRPNWDEYDTEKDKKKK
ncbi:MAG TPA: hypothetical protein VML75_26030 [Kofleriaceae bacterium]|nr:hypothetical protein [Kofleriaceae bacterium]